MQNNWKLVIITLYEQIFKLIAAARRGAETPGGYIPPIIWLHPPQ